ncbi:amidohydrolase family protein [Actinomadura chibensis]|uniref:Amidohydrolase n=1 Tax=Actinomadura chibensis TaxID=392828 RepID=A0A5D0NI91_9ACTN|nr:amidohydrolase family protein [Actinomadura chibensis]TYB44103.1 amidohydrolase [Actinomadura chibensis]
MTNNGTLKRIALEEAFSLPGMGSKVGTMVGDPHYRADAVAGWNRRLTDFTEFRIPDMDAHGIDVQVLSLTAPGIQAERDTAEAVAKARAANDFLAETIAAHPTRFAGLAALPMQDPAAARAELDRAVGGLGLRGALVNGHTLGRYLDEKEFRPVWERLEELRVPLYLHPGAPPRDEWQVFRGHPYLKGPTFGWAAETAAHALRLIYAGVFDDFPGAKLILGHMGEFLPFQKARLDARYEFMTLRLGLRPSEYLERNVMITTTGVCSGAALTGAIAAVGADNIMFGVDYPFERTDVAVRFLDEAPISETDRAKIAHGNAERILGL